MYLKPDLYTTSNEDRGQQGRRLIKSIVSHLTHSGHHNHNNIEGSRLETWRKPRFVSLVKTSIIESGRNIYREELFRAENGKVKIAGEALSVP